MELNLAKNSGEFIWHMRAYQVSISCCPESIKKKKTKIIIIIKNNNSLYHHQMSSFVRAFLLVSGHIKTRKMFYPFMYFCGHMLALLCHKWHKVVDVELQTRRRPTSMLYVIVLKTRLSHACAVGVSLWALLSSKLPDDLSQTRI